MNGRITNERAEFMADVTRLLLVNAPREFTAMDVSEELGRYLPTTRRYLQALTDKGLVKQERPHNKAPYMYRWEPTL